MKISKVTVITFIVAFLLITAVAVQAVLRKDLILVQNQPAQSNSSDNDSSTTKKSIDEQTKPSACQTGELSASAAIDKGGGAAGSIYATLVIKNESKRTCIVTGYPGVSLVDANGNQIGEPADKTNEQSSAVALAPSETAKAQLRFVENNFDDGICQTGATQLKIYPPNQTTALAPPTPHTEWCPGFEVGPLKVS